MIAALLLALALQPSTFLQQGFTSLDPAFWEKNLSGSCRTRVTMSPAGINGADLGRDQLVLLVRGLKRDGTTATFEVKEFTMGNSPKGMAFLHADWVYRGRDGTARSLACFFTMDLGPDGWALSELHCQDTP